MEAAVGTTLGRAQSVLGRPRFPNALLWVVPVVVAVGVAGLSQHRLEVLIAGGVAVLLLMWAVRHPGPSLSILAVLASIQAFLFGLLYGLHVPAFILRAGGGLKDLFGIALLIAAVAHMAASRRRLDWLEGVILVYVGVVTLYLLLPALLAPGSPHQWNVRLIAWRLNAGYPLLFIAVRNAPITVRAREWFAGTVVAVGGLAAGFAAWQYASPNGFYKFIVNTAKQVAYQTNVLHASPATVQNVLQYLKPGGSQLHLGSIFVSPFDLADYMVIVAAVIVERLVRGDRRPLLVAIFGLIVFALFASQVRADAVGALVVFLVALMPSAGRPVLARWRFVLALAIGAALVVPALGGTRFAGGHKGGVSTQAHVQEVTSGVNALLKQPLGLGLGKNPVTNDRFLTPGTYGLTSDNSYLQVGDEVGVLAMAPWLIFVFGALMSLRRRARAPSAVAAAAGLALLGILVTGAFHHVFLGFSTAWTLWALVGLGLSRAEPVDLAGGPPAPSRPADLALV